MTFIKRVFSKDKRGWLFAAVLLCWTVGVGVKVYTDKTGPDESNLVSSIRSIGSIDWNGETSSRAGNASAVSASTAQASTSAAAIEAPPVADLLSRLVARLEADPNDSKGWVLLAQSYAFMGDRDGAERAMAHAIDLGVDEGSLRERVNASMREQHAGNWIEAAVGR